LYASAYLKSILTSKEFHKTNVLQIQNLPYEVCYAYLRFLHTEELPDDPRLLIHLAGLAEAFLRKQPAEIEEKLKTKCAKMLRKAITVEHAVEFLTLSMQHRTDAMYEVCVKYMLEHLNEVIQTPEFKKLDPVTEKIFMLRVSDFGKKQERKSSNPGESENRNSKVPSAGAEISKTDNESSRC
jgi:hypothetical protein